MQTGLRVRRFGSYLALFAFVFQFSLAFGHVELPGILHHSGLLQNVVEKLVTGDNQRSQTGDHGSPGHKSSDSCQLCWLQSAAGSATLPDAAQPSPIALSAMLAWNRITSLSVPFIALAYQVRAPPVALPK